MGLAQGEREDLADFLAGLTLQQWGSASWCDGWTVRDVAAHVVSFEGLSVADLLTRFVRGRLQTARINGLGIAALADSSTDDLIALLRDNAEPRGLGAGFGGRIALTDNMIHHQDIRRPLGIPRTIPPERLRVALDFVRYSPTIRGAVRVRGVRLIASDLDWSYGRGPEVRGPGEALLMVLAGRPAALGDLDGPGVGTLATRL